MGAERSQFAMSIIHPRAVDLADEHCAAGSNLSRKCHSPADRQLWVGSCRSACLPSASAAPRCRARQQTGRSRPVTLRHLRRADRSCPYPRAVICFARRAACCSTPKMKLDARRGQKGSPRTYSPGTSVMPRRCIGAPRASNAPTCNQPKSNANPVAQMIAVIPAPRRSSRRPPAPRAGRGLRAPRRRRPRRARKDSWHHRPRDRAPGKG